jgi:hypothetical protein
MIGPNDVTHRRIVSYDTSMPLGEQVLDVAVAQGEAEIHPDGVLNHVGLKAVTDIIRRGHGYRYAARGRPARPRT